MTSQPETFESRIKRLGINTDALTTDDQAALELSFEAFSSTTIDPAEKTLAARYQAAVEQLKTQLLSEHAQRISRSRPAAADQIRTHMEKRQR